MGLLGGLFKGIAGVIPGVSAIFNGQAISKANKATQAGITQGVNAINANQATATDNYKSYIEAGSSASEQIRRLLGLGDHNTGQPVGDSPAMSAVEQQAGALSGLRDSPLFQQLFKTGEEAVLQNASATGGIRGGNVQNGLAENGETAFASTLQNILSQLGGVSSQGLSATSGLTGVSTNSANALAGLFGQSGSANAGAILGQQNVSNQLSQQITSILAGLGGGGSGGGGITLPGSVSGDNGGINNIAKVLQNSNSGSIFTRGF